MPIADRKAPGLTYLTLSRTFSYRALFCPMVLFPGLLPDPLNKSVGFVQQYAGRIGLTFAQKNTLAAPSHLGFPYGSFRFPLILLMPIGMAGFVLAFRWRVPSILVTAGWVLFWLVEYVLAGPTSSYWGMHVMPMAYLGCALLPVALMGAAPADRTGAPAGDSSNRSTTLDSKPST